MKRIIFLVFTLFIIFQSNAQSVGIHWGPELGKPKKTDVSAMIGASGDSFFTLRRGIGLFNRDEIYLEKYSKLTLRLENVRPVKLLGVNGRRLVFEQAFVLGPTVLVFLSYYDKDQDRNIAYVQKIDASDGSIFSPSKEIDFIPAAKKRNAGSFDFVLSKDSSKILIMHNDPFDKYANEKFSYKVLDANGEEIWSAALELPYRDASFTISNYIVDNRGDVFMLARLPVNMERDRRSPGYKYELLSYDHASRRLKEWPIEMGDKFISDIAFDIHRNDTLIIGGFYSTGTSGGVGGSFFISMNARTLEIIAQGGKDFTSEFLGEFMSKRKADKHRELYNYRIDHLLTKVDGGAYIVAEQYYMLVSTYYSRYGSSVTYHYYYNDIIVVNVNSDGSIGWIKKIPKFQHSTNDNGYYSSYAMKAMPDKLYFVFNDNPKNLNPQATKIRPAFSWRAPITVVATIDQTGAIKREALRGSNLGRIYTRPKLSMNIGNSETLIYALKRKSFRFGVINYQKSFGDL